MQRHHKTLPQWLAVVGPGFLVAATGVGAGDLATAAFTGGQLGTTVLWAVVVGALLKYALTEGLARWQLVTGETLLEGASRRFGRAVRWPFLVYLVFWSFFVGAALISAAGATAAAMMPPEAIDSLGGTVRAKIVLGVLHSIAAAMIVLWGRYRLFERVMHAMIAVMFVTVTACAVALVSDWGEIVRGLCLPVVDRQHAGGVSWTIALIGGVGGTLTILCYGYWIREEGRCDPRALPDTRVDLAVGYAATALFGMAMVVIGSSIEPTGRGATLMIRLADRLQDDLGLWARWSFLLGAWSAVATSLLGVWQSVPYLFADFWRLRHDVSSFRSGCDRSAPVLTRTWAYRGYLLLLATLPVLGTQAEFRQVQKLYAVVGAMFLPMLAAVLLLMNGRADWLGRQYRNGPLATLTLLATLVFFAAFGWLQLTGQFG